MWCIEYDPALALLTVRVSQSLGSAHVEALRAAHSEALGNTGGAPFGVLHDLRGVAPLDVPTAEAFSAVRSAEIDAGCIRRAVVASSATIALQQRRVSVETPGPTTMEELVTLDEGEAVTFLER